TGSGTNHANIPFNASLFHKCPSVQMLSWLPTRNVEEPERISIGRSDVDFRKGLLHVRFTITKNGKDRWIPLNSSLRQLLEKMRAERPKESADKTVMRVFECQKSIDRAAKLVGVKRITHHDLRHLFATRCIEAGVDIPTVSRWLWHQDGGALCMKTYGQWKVSGKRNRRCARSSAPAG
ncbi:MAG: tyrosine-type recombinase/integrase, partial [Verrucomicrobia bacterium]|nr:tyrosine-type recombinase/integrase [Verrucomicrobiota bacterium]